MYRLLNVTEEEFNKFISGHIYGDFEQVTLWGELKEMNGWTWEYLAVGDDEIKGGALLLFKKLPKLNKTLCYLPRGPVLDWTDEKLFIRLFEEIKLRAKKHNAIMIKIDPDVEEGNKEVLNLLLSNKFIHHGFLDGLSSATQPRFHMITPLEEDLDSIFLKFSSRTKTKIRKALKNPLVFEDVCVDKLEVFHTLMEETGLRDGFSTRNLAYFKKMFELMNPSGNCKVFLISLNIREAIDLQEKEVLKLEKEIGRFENKGDKYFSHIEGLRKALNDKRLLIKRLEDRLKNEEKIYLSGNFYVQLGRKAYYLYGASSNEFREFLPNYFMQYKSIEFAKNNGALSYDWGGITGREGKDKDDAPGLYEFKKQWATYKRARIGEFDYVISSLWYKLYNLAIKILKR
ncbi:lipid II:glycine glycyltransferase FemX [Peptoniphilaceae bacterium SGI.131]